MAEYNIDFKTSPVPKQSVDIAEGLNCRELNFKYQLIKGRIAENLIQELFLSEGYKVFKFGIENNLPYLMQQIRTNKSQQALSLRVAPDLIIYDEKEGEIFYTEVKFCSNGNFDLDSRIELDKYMNCYPNTVFFIVNPEGIFVVEVERFRESRRIALNEEYSIFNYSRFSLRTKVIEQFEEIAWYLLSGIPKRSRDFI